MATDARDQYDAVVEEMTATSPSKSSKTRGMPCLKNENGRAFAGFSQEAMVSEARRCSAHQSAREARRAALRSDARPAHESVGRGPGCASGAMARAGPTGARVYYTRARIGMMRWP